ncbi:uncharacterized protein PAC_05331 [Phialocephala subalpina]|uniref:Heterokaryon incompatibility domain-containing protein n=1 Tax=Phialocephala subalpina TaxID=576137 RepID=A0A1L7WRP4_9HELO|nr:uncharacterized protein PAC_05331 [Phialocephala subalpina]
MSLCAQCSKLAAWLLSNELKNAVLGYKQDVENGGQGGAARVARIFPFKYLKDKHTSEAASNQKCPLCELILHTPSTNLEGGNYFGRLCPLGRQISVWTPGNGWHNTLEWQEKSFELYSTNGNQSLWRVRDHLGSHPLSDTTISIIEPWLVDCLQTHQECHDRHRSRPVPWPARLIDVGSADGADEPHLVDSDEVQYWTEWDEDRITLQARKKSIPMRTLNRTLADAVLVTRRLRLQYLWIDSLCIIQDSAADWNQESAGMCHVYNNAVVNIAAISAENADDRFLHNRHTPVFLSRTSIGKFCDEFDENGLWLRPSTAVELGRHTLSEKTPNFTEAVDAQISGFTRMIHDNPDLIQDRNFAYSMWRGIVEQYSTKELTYEKDRLPALSGLASRFGKLFNDRYLAGLWESDIPIALCWQAMSKHTGLNAGPHIAPSWSWVPYSQVTYGRNLETVTWEAFAQQCFPEPVSDPYGQVYGGTLLIQGRVLSVTLEAREQSPWPSSTDESLWHAVVMVLERQSYDTFKRVGLVIDHLDIDQSATPKDIWEGAETDWITITSSVNRIWTIREDVTRDAQQPASHTYPSQAAMSRYLGLLQTAKDSGILRSQKV